MIQLALVNGHKNVRSIIRKPPFPRLHASQLTLRQHVEVGCILSTHGSNSHLHIQNLELLPVQAALQSLAGIAGPPFWKELPQTKGGNRESENRKKLYSSRHVQHWPAYSAPAKLNPALRHAAVQDSMVAWPATPAVFGRVRAATVSLQYEKAIKGGKR